MNATALLKELRGCGLELASDGDHLRYRPKNVITPELVDRLKTHKWELIELLAQEERYGLAKADRPGLVIRWSEYPTWISLRDPTTAEWHEVRASECLPGIIESANAHR